MKYTLLDGVGAGFLVFFFLIGLVFIIVAILMEALVMQKMKYHATYKKCLGQSTVVNLVSLAAGYVIIESGGELFQIDNLAGFAILFAVTVVLEGLVLFLMNNKIPVIQTIKVSLVMNLVSYAIALLIIQVA